MAEFFAMGGYAPYVWSTFGVTLVVLVINVVMARRRWRQSLREAGKRARRRHRRQES